jgi:hypothetical protein
MIERSDLPDTGLELPDERDSLAVKAEWLLDRLEELDPEENLEVPGLGEVPVFSAAEALYEALRLNHRGTGSDEYRSLCRLGRIFRPGVASVGLDESGREVYRWLVRSRG